MALNTFSRVNGKPYLSKNKSVRLFKEKQKRRDEYARQRQELISQYDKIDFISTDSFNQLPLSNETQRGLKKCNYHTLTEIQRETIGLALQSHDILGAAKTGSGKTLAFVVPVLERLFCEGWSKMDGLGALVISPTRELALQIFQVFQNVGSFHDFSVGFVIGGKDLRRERKILHLYNIVICTPGRLLMHMDQNSHFQTTNLQMLVLDEADRILDEGFQNDVNAILEHLGNVNRQTLLFSATQTKSVKDLARLSLNNPTYVSVHEHSKHATPEGLEQSFLVCELHRKMDFLWAFIKNHKKQKILIFMASCKQVKYTFDAFCRMKPGVSLTALYGGLHQLRRMERYQDFCQKNHVIMFATDIASRGLDFPNVNWVIQLDCPEDVNTYIHRAGRTARYQKGGESLLILLPSEKEPMLKLLEDRKIPIAEIKVHPKKLMPVQRKMEIQCSRDMELKESARRAFVSYYKNIFLMKDKTVFDIAALNAPEVRQQYARSLGLTLDPRTRFIEKRLKTKVVSKQRDNSAKSNDEKDTFALNDKLGADCDFDVFRMDSSDDEDDGDFIVPKTATQNSCHLPELTPNEEEEMKTSKSSKNRKPLTKVAAAKKILKKKIKPNVKTLFDEDGNVIEDLPKKIKGEISKKLAKEMTEEGCYDIEKAKLIMEHEDKIDKELYREKIKQKHKEERLKRKEQRRKENNGSTSAQLGENNNEDEKENQSSENEIDPNNMSDSNDDDHVGSDDDDRVGSNDDGNEPQDDSKSSDLCDGEENLKRKRVTNKKKSKSLKKFKSGCESETSNQLHHSSNLEDEEHLALHFLGKS